MTTATRLSVFFLAAIAVVLAGFSCAVYALAHWRLHWHLDAQIESALHVLVASIEVHPNDVEWEPLERDVRLGRNTDIAEVRWVIRDEAGTLVDHSANLTTPEASRFPDNSVAWRIDRRRMTAGVFEPLTVEAADVPSAEASSDALGENRTAVRQRFYLVVAVAEQPVHDALSQLAIVLVCVSSLVWAVCAVFGRWLCRQALRPVAQMANEAREIQNAPDGERVLAVPPTNDEVTELATAFNSLLNSLRVQVEQQRRFAGDASHQLRTPLTAMLTAVDVTARFDRSTEEYRRTLDVVTRRGRELEQIISTLLLLARNENPTASTPSETIELNDWVGEQIERWADNPRWADIRRINHSDRVLAVTHSAMLGQVFGNVLENACKYGEAGTPITVNVTALPVDEAIPPTRREATITIENYGFGLSPADLSQVFQPFFRSQQARLTGVSGVGLGLSIAKRLIEFLGGRIEVTSCERGATRFSIVIPCIGGEQPAGAPLEPADAVAPASLHWKQAACDNFGNL